MAQPQISDNRVCKTTFQSLMPMVCLMTFAVLSSCGGGGGNTPAPPTKSDVIKVSFGISVLDHTIDQTITLANKGTTTLTVGQIDREDALVSPFTLSNENCSGTSLAPSKTCSLQVRFSPIEQGVFSDTFDIPSRDANQNLATVAVSGEGIALNVSINQVDTDCLSLQNTIYVTITDRYEDPVTLVPLDAFTVTENGEPVDVSHFSNAAVLPLSVVLALDSSNSALSVRADIEAAATSFIQLLQLDDGIDEAEIIKFAATIQPVQTAFTDSQAALIAAIAAPFSGLQTQTVLYDAIWRSIEDMNASAQAGRRAIVVLSDGFDEGSDKSLPEVIDHAIQSGVPVFTIVLGNGVAGVMQQLADETGGQFFQVPVSTDLQGIYEKISTILTNQYVLTYTSSATGETGAILDVQVNLEGGGEILHGEDLKEVSGCP